MIGVPAAARKAVAIVLEGLLPADCLLCAGWLPWRQQGGVCPGCWENLPWSPGLHRPRRGPLAAVAWAADYGGAIRRLVHILKFEHFDPVGIALGRAAARRLPPLPLPSPRPPRSSTAPRAPARPAAIAAPLVVPVPLHWTRRLHRGYNHAHLLAQGVARELSLPILPRALVRRRRGRHQVGLTRTERRAALADVFAARPRHTRALEDRVVLLVDDVVTTRATLEACAAALKHAGARTIIGIAIARTPKEK